MSDDLDRLAAMVEGGVRELEARPDNPWATEIDALIAVAPELIAVARATQYRYRALAGEHVHCTLCDARERADEPLVHRLDCPVPALDAALSAALSEVEGTR